MAEKSDNVFKSHLTCQVCHEIFKEPVSLSCSHNFCSSCLQKFWKEAEDKTCPTCRRRQSKDETVVNFTLKSLADHFAGRQKCGSSEKGTGKAEQEEDVVCHKHPGAQIMFCKDEQKAVCNDCEFSTHQSHIVVPLENAVRLLKEQLKFDLDSLQDKRDKCKQVEKKYKELNELSKNLQLSTETQIRAEFDKLRDFLREEEESRLAALSEEEEQKAKAISREIRTVEEQISSLSDSISAVTEKLQQPDVPFLSSYKQTWNNARVQCLQPDPQPLPGILIDMTKHLGNLTFSVWKKMKDMVSFSPVILDPNTANSRLCLSEDLTSVRCGDSSQQLLNNPERYSYYSNVLGSEGFTFGKHSWDVEVGDHPRWSVGIVKESADRKNDTVCSPENGFWCLKHLCGKYSTGVGEAVPVKKRLQKIRVQLDYDWGDVSFYDGEDMTHLHTHRDTFTEKLFPFFGIEGAGDAKTANIKICQRKISLKYK